MSKNVKAFPKSRTVNQDGMDLRDYFAGQALAGNLQFFADYDVTDPSLIAKHCCLLADAMMKEREND